MKEAINPHKPLTYIQLNLNTVALLEFFIVHLSTIKESMAYYGQFLQAQYRYDFNYKQSTFVILITYTITFY